MKTPITAALLSLSLAVPSAASAWERMIDVEVANLTNATYFTPLLVATHGSGLHLFQVGEPASTHLQAMAEGGNIDGLVSDVESADGHYVANPAGGLLAPGMSVTASMKIENYKRNLSVAAMLLPTNDGFVGLDGVRVPRARGTYTYYLRGYDAGTEANDELVTGGGAPGAPGIPADPGGFAGSGGSGVAGADHNPNVHIHRGVVGDHDEAGGASDLDAGVHRWQGPVAKVTVTVRRASHY